MVIHGISEHISPPEIARVRSVIATFKLVMRVRFSSPSAAFTLLRPEALRPVVIEH